MSDDLRQAFREMFPGLEPGVRVIDGERRYSAAFLDQQMRDDFLEFAEPPAPVVTAEESLASVKTQRADAIFELAKLVEVAGYGHLNVAVHELPLQFFARPDMGPLTTLKSGDELFFTARLTIGGHSFQCFSRGFPLEAE